MNSAHEKFIFDSSAFYTFIRHYKDQIRAQYEINYFYFDTKDMALIQNNQTARIRSISSADCKNFFEFKLNTDIIKTKNEDIITTISAFLKPSDIDTIIIDQAISLTHRVLPQSIIKKVSETTQEKSIDLVAIYKIMRKYLTLGEITIKADICTYENNNFYEISFDANNMEEAKEKMKDLFKSLNVSYSFSTLSKLSRIDVFMPYLNKLK
ncbi:hypothetical protein M9Y10_038750 [Tritrichomonas musculus]|uniref:CYTH domain-containing protein n=1 Tax=Tritrichomonas musculus TaxID=1915356 RepID=A0ABR2K9A5_9EUKA